MSPLARSLLAFAALLAAADARFDVINIVMPPGSPCTAFKATAYDDTKFGTMTVTTEFKSDSDVAIHYIPDNCRPHNLTIASQILEACNGYKNPSPPNQSAPRAHAIGQDFSPIYASCEGRPQCLPIVFKVTQKCILTLGQSRRHG